MKQLQKDWTVKGNNLNRAHSYRHLANLTSEPIQRNDFLQRAQEDEKTAEGL